MENATAAQWVTAARQLTEKVMSCASGKLRFRILYWGMEREHYDNPVHRHSFYEACYVRDGTGEYEEEGAVYALRSGSLFLSRPGHWHQIRSKAGLQLMYVAYELGRAEGDMGNTEQESVPKTETEDVSEAERYELSLTVLESPVIEGHERATSLLWRTLFLQSQQEDSAERLSALGGLLLTAFVADFAPSSTPPAAPERTAARPSSQLVQLAKRFIRDNLSRPLKLEDVAAYLHVSDRHLSRMFNKHGGDTFKEYVVRERMQAAERSLKTTVLSIQEIAEGIGFQSVHYFTRVFAEHYGLPPAAYRKQNMGQKANGMWQ